MIYSVLFIGLSSWKWHGAWAVVLLGLFGVEIILTLWDFVVEDKTRLLPATERVTHTVLAMNGGAFIMLLILNASTWLSESSALAWESHGLLGLFLALCDAGVGLSGVRDVFAAYRLGETAKKDKSVPSIHFSANAENVLVTGGTGFIGQSLVRALLADGQNVTVLTRNPKRAARMFDGQVRCIGSMGDLPATQAIDVIINLAGARILGRRWTSARQAFLRKSRIDLTQNLVDWIASAKQKPRLLVSASAIGYYGIQPEGDDAVLTEDSPPQSIFMSQLCQDWEAVAQRAGKYGVRVTCMRLGLVLGNQGPLPMLLLPIKLGLGGPLGGGKQWLSWIHVHDVLRGIAHLWKRSAQSEQASQGFDVYNFTAPEAVTQKQFSQIAAKVMHRPCVFPTPGFPIRLVLGEQADLLLAGQRVAPSRLNADGFIFSYPNLRIALESFS